MPQYGVAQNPTYASPKPPPKPPPQLSAPALLNHPPPGPLRAAPPPSGGFIGGVAHAIGSVGQATQHAAQAAATPHNSPSPGSDIQSSGAGYGAAQANAFKATQAYRQAVVDTFLHQSKGQATAIIRGALTSPSYEGKVVLNYLRSQGLTGTAGGVKLSDPFAHDINLGSAITKGLGGLLTPHQSDLQKLTAKIGGPTSPAGLLKTTGGAGVKALGALSQPSDLQKLTAKIGGATSPQDVLRVGGAVGSALINAIPTRKPYGPAEQIAAQQQGMVPGGIGKHLLQGAINTPAEVFPSMAIPIGEALNNHWGQAIKSFTGPYAQMFHSPKAFEQFVYNNPFQAALMFQGVTHPAATALDTAQSVVRGKGIPNVIPESVHLTGNLTHERPNFSRSPITRRAQKDIAKQIYKRNPRTGQLVPRSYTHSTHLIRMETSRMVGQANRVRAVGHAEQLVAHGNAVLQNRVGRAAHAAKTTLAVNPEPALIHGANVLALVARGVVNPRTWVHDLNRVIEMVAANRPHLEGADLKTHDQFIKTLVKARDNPPKGKAMDRVIAASNAYAKDYAYKPGSKTLETQAHQLGHYRDMTPEALQRSTYMAAYRTHIPGARMDPVLGMVRDGDKAGAAAELARLRARATVLEKQAEAVSARRMTNVSGHLPVDRHLNPSPGTALADVNARIRAVRATNAAPVSTAEMVKAVDKYTGGRDLAFTSHQEPLGDKAHYVKQEARPSVAAEYNTLYNFTHGLTDPSHMAMLEQRVRMQGIVDAHHAVNRLDQQLVHTGERGLGWESHAAAEHAAKGSGMTPIRLAKQFHPPSALKKSLEADHVNMNTLQDEAAMRSLDITSRLQNTSDPGRYGLIHPAAADQLLAHEKLISPTFGGRAVRSLNSQFRKVALATSFRHLPGVAQEVAIRSAMSGVGVVSWFGGRAVIKRAKEIDPRIGRQRQIEHTGGMVYGQALSLQTRSVSSHYANTLLHPALKAFEGAMRAPGLRQASTLWHAWMKLTLQGTKKVLEEQTGVAAIGKSAIQAQGGLLGLIGGGLHTWGRMVDQAAHGILDENTSRQMGAFARRMYGRWTDLTPTEQQALLLSPFGMWWTNSIAWLARMPIDHPMGAAFQGALNVGTQKQREAMGLDMFAPNHLPLYKQGGVKVGGNLFNMNYYSPVGTLNDPAGTAASLIAPWATPVIAALFGDNWLGHTIRSPGNPTGRNNPSPSDITSVILGSLAASFVPLYQKAQTLVQGGASSYDTSSLLSPQTKGPNPGLLQGLKKDVYPLRKSKATQGATLPTGTGGGSGGGWSVSPPGGGGGSSQPSGSGSSGGGWSVHP